MKNVKSITKTKEQKEQCAQDNRIILDYAYYLGGGIFIKQQLLTIISLVSNIPYKKLKVMVSDLYDKGLLIQKQATTTKTTVYVMAGFALAQYLNCTSQNATSIKLNNRKIWINIFRMEYIIREVLPKAIGKINTCEELIKWMDDRFIDIFRIQNQEEIFKLYFKFYQEYPVLNKSSLSKVPEGEFINDYFACTAEYHDFLLHFQNKNDKAKHYEGYENYKKKKQMNYALYGNAEDRNKYCFNFSQMAGQGFFILSLLKDNVIEMGLFDTYKNIQLSKIYQNSIYILFMFQRYLGFVPHIKMTVYVRDEYIKARLERDEERKAYNY